jgi:hypothetical protein
MNLLLMELQAVSHRLYACMRMHMFQIHPLAVGFGCEGPGHALQVLQCIGRVLPS